MGQCFQDIDLTKWISVIVKQCPNNADPTKANFNKCIRDYLEAVARFPNIGNKLIHWLRNSKKPALMPMHEFMRHQVQLFSYLDGGYLHHTMDISTVQEKSEQIFFAQPKVHQNKFANLNKTVPTDPLMMNAFFEQCQAVIDRLYSVQYKSIFGAPDKVRCNTCDKARLLSQVQGAEPNTSLGKEAAGPPHHHHITIGMQDYIPT
jgi:hypothetical protein